MHCMGCGDSSKRQKRYFKPELATRYDTPRFRIEAFDSFAMSLSPTFFILVLRSQPPTGGLVAASHREVEKVKGKEV